LEKVIAATFSALDAQVNPYALTFAFLAAAKSAGALL
jgi:glycine/D-amino acid oxidase-like deaminating enzyme